MCRRAYVNGFAFLTCLRSFLLKVLFILITESGIKSSNIFRENILQDNYTFSSKFPVKSNVYVPLFNYSKSEFFDIGISIFPDILKNQQEKNVELQVSFNTTTYRNAFGDLDNISIPQNSSKNLKIKCNLSRKRNHRAAKGFTKEQEKEIIRLHNLYRSNVTPPAGDMSFMEWDDQLADIALQWAKRCKFDHGLPSNTYPDTIGQNLYRGGEATGIEALYLWYEERVLYNIKTGGCEPIELTQQCGHYTQMIWADSKLIGCAKSYCGRKKFLIVCHYSPGGNFPGVLPYQVAESCSQCVSKDGGLCTHNLCVTKEQCDRNPSFCTPECQLRCKNCGSFDSNKCRCHCLQGWDSLDCSKVCADQDDKCGKNPGWPRRISCSMNPKLVGDKLCRKMCHRCVDVTHKWNEARNETCCGGLQCSEGYVLDLERRLCKCRLLCPGPQCDKSRSSDLKFITLLILLLHILTFLQLGSTIA